MNSLKPFFKLNYFLIVIFMFAGFSLSAQQPAWVDYAKRNNMYPPSEYLVGFVSGEVGDNDEPGQMMEKLESLARDKVVQSIQVSIESNNSLNISNINGKTNEEFLSKSVSFSKADINGLRTDHYFDRKKKMVYAIAYVNINRLVYYYKNIISTNINEIEQKIKEGKNFLQHGNKEDALRSFYEAMPLLSEIDQAQMLLIALDKKEYVDLYSKRINDARLTINEEINNLQRSGNLNISEAAYFVAYGLYLQLKDFKGSISLEYFTFENTGLTSPFSRRWNDELFDALKKAGFNNINKSGAGGSNVLGGNYWSEGTALRVHARVVQGSKLLAVSEGNIPLSLLKQEDIDYMPPQFKKLGELDGVKLEAINPAGSFKIGEAAKEPLKVRAVKSIDGVEKPVPNLPILFKEKHSNKTLCKGKTNGEGIAFGFLPALKYNQPVLEIEAVVDIAEFASIDTNSMFYATYKSDILPADFKLTSKHQLFYINSSERLRGYPMDVKMIEPVIKKFLSDNDYHFTNDPSKADKTIKINANTTAATYTNGIWFSYLDATLSVIDNSNNEEVFKTNLEQIKGAGANSVKAGKKAYSIASQKLKDKLAEYLSK